MSQIICSYLCRVRQKFVLIISLVFLVNSTKAQIFSALQNSNFSGVNLIYTNPAQVAMMTHKRSATVGVIGYDLTNDYFSLEAPFSLWKLITGGVDDKYRNPDGSIDWQKKWLKEDPNRNDINFNLSTEFRGPSYVNHYGRFVWGTATRTRSTLDINGLSTGAWSWGRQWLDSQKLESPLVIISDEFEAQANSYQELSAVLAAKVVDGERFKLGIGTTLKGILGLGSVNIKNNGIKFNGIGMDTVEVTSGYMEVAYTDNSILRQLFSGVLSGGLPRLSEIHGLGFGMDAGISMEFGKDMSTGENEQYKFRDYKFKVAASVTDIGQIGYTNANDGFIIDGSNGFKMPLTTPEFANAVEQGSQAVLDHIIETARNEGVLKSNNKTTRVTLPSTMHLQLDYKVYTGFLIAAHWQQRFNWNQGDFQFASRNSLTVVPRFEHKWFEFALPIRYQANFDPWSFGGFLRLGPVFFGTDNMANMFRASKYSGMNLYMGITTLIK